jgi:hypothetical protein
MKFQLDVVLVLRGRAYLAREAKKGVVWCGEKTVEVFNASPPG